MKKAEFDWAVVGGGISGVALSEMLSRNGHSVIILEKNSKLASETTKEFHEWLHTGVLFSLVPDNFSTTRYLLGALDDLLEFYSSFGGMNITKLEQGLQIRDEGWFNKDWIYYNYRNRPTNPAWMYSVAKSILLSETISNHDWLRRHAGGDEIIAKLKTDKIIKKMLSIYKQKNKYISIKSSDFTINSRKLLAELLSAAMANGTKVYCENAFERISEYANYVKIRTQNGEYSAKNVVFCSPDLIAKLFGSKIKYGYAPMGVFEGVPDDQKSFVNLDFYTRNCINLLRKKDGLGLAGGITVNKQSDVKDYFDYVHSEHIKLNPSLRLINNYVGVKKELVDANFKRNYQYHIQKNSERQWSVVLGKFSLFASLAVEFYRRVYSVNPVLSKGLAMNTESKKLIEPTFWAEITSTEEM